MLISYRWLRELIPALEAPPEEVAERLTRAGLAVDAVTPFGAGLDAVVVAAVRKVEPHPKRDKLRLVTVDRGGAEQRVVCGAPNVPEPGGLVVLAGVGTKLPGLDFTLDAREIGGVKSEGMLCSEREMGLGEDADGILVLDDGSATPGTPLTEALPASDTIFELDITPNRPDALGHRGVARELAALYQLELPPFDAGTPLRESSDDLGALVSVDNQDTERCPHYGAAVVLGVQIGPSPAWLRWRLHALGIRPISNVVDITNLLLLEFGQPLHAFDLDRVRGQRIIVRRAQPAEPFTTLDGVARKLEADDLVIADAEGPSALAGVMGGEESEIRDTTSRVLLECAYFDPRGVRRTSRRHGLHTESSHRFERGVDWAAVPSVLERARVLLTELASGQSVPGAIHAKGKSPELSTMRLRSERLDRLLGVQVPFEEATGILGRLGFEVKPNGDEAEVRGASWRPDVAREVDLIEEVARVRGLDAIPTVLPAIAPQTPRTTGQLERRATGEAVALGLSEALTYAFVSPGELEAVRAPKSVVALQNPLTEERSVMRTSLLPGLLEALGRARRHGERQVRLYSVAPLFVPAPDQPGSQAAAQARPRLDADRGALPLEQPAFAAVLAGPRPAYLSKPADVDVYDAKGLALELVERLCGRRASVRPAKGAADTAHLHPRGAAHVTVGEQIVGRFGPLHPDVVEALDLDGDAQVVELDLQAIEALGTVVPQYSPIARLPAVTRDLALVLSDDVPAGDAEQLIRQAAGKLCESIELFDLFRGGSIPEGHRSLAFRLTYRDPKATRDPDNARTLTDQEVDKVHEQVVAAAKRELGAELRG